MTKTTALLVELTVGCLPHHEKVDVEKIFEPVLEALAGSRGVVDPDLAADSSDSTLTFSMYIPDATSPEDALKRTMAVARAALHAAGVHTPGWEAYFDLTFKTTTIDRRELASA